MARSRKTAGRFFASEVSRKLLVQLAFGAAGFLVSRGAVFGQYAPFGVALAAAAPFSNLGAALAGTLLGYLIPSSVHGVVRYIAALIACAAIRWTLNDLKRIRSHALFAPLVALCPLLLTGLAMGTVDGFSSDFIVMNLTEALLAAGAAYFFTRAVQTVSGSRGLSTLNQQELACLVLAAGIVILSLAGVTVGSISIGRVLAVLAILFCARYGGVAGGGVAGIAAGIVFSLSAPGVSYLSGAYAFGGLMAGLFSPVGKIGTAAAFILSNGIISLQAGDGAMVIAGLYEVMAATLIFIVLPRDAGNRLSLLFAQRSDQPRTDGLRRSVMMRLDFASKALSDVSDTVDTVSKKLRDLCAPDINGVYSRAIDDTCRRCGLKVFCWEKEYNNTMSAFNDVTSSLRRKGAVEIEDFPPPFARRCSRIGEMTDTVNRYYGEFMTREAAERRISEVRAVVADQFSGMSEILADMVSELEVYDKFDFASAERVTAALRASGILPVEVSCRIDRWGRMTVEIEAAEVDLSRIGKPSVLREISRACDRAFESPCISAAPDCCRLLMSEKAAYRTEVGAAQHACDQGQLCGDHYDVFADGRGRMVVIISDGMGTGGRAAVDGAMAAGIMGKLIKAGLGFDCALRIVNSALVVKSGDESLATLDVATVDLFSGQAEFRKAGAPLTLMRRRGRVVRVDAPSLPAGILSEIHFSTESAQLEEGDWLLLVSDGAVAAGDDWLCDLLGDYEGEDAQKLAELVIKEARERRRDGHDDDITAVAVRLERQSARLGA